MTRPAPSAEHADGRAGFVSMRPPAERGFTLVELMVVLTVIALAAGAVAWSLPDPRGRVADEAARFATRAKAARDEAVVTGVPTSLWVTSAGYGFEARTDAGWVAERDGTLGVVRWGEGTRVTFPGSGRVRVIFDPTGLADRPLDVTLARRDATTLVRIGGDGGVRVGA